MSLLLLVEARRTAGRFVFGGSYVAASGRLHERNGKGSFDAPFISPGGRPGEGAIGSFDRDHRV